MKFFAWNPKASLICSMHGIFVCYADITNIIQTYFTKILYAIIGKLRIYTKKTKSCLFYSIKAL